MRSGIAVQCKIIQRSHWKWKLDMAKRMATQMRTLQIAQMDLQTNLPIKNRNGKSLSSSQGSTGCMMSHFDHLYISWRALQI
jgi:hypothetical protein